MGGSTAGNFGNTKGSREYDGRSVLGSVSNVLTGASLIPGLDTFTNLIILKNLTVGNYLLSSFFVVLIRVLKGF